MEGRELIVSGWGWCARDEINRAGTTSRQRWKRWDVPRFTHVYRSPGIRPFNDTLVLLQPLRCPKLKDSGALTRTRPSLPPCGWSWRPRAAAAERHHAQLWRILSFPASTALLLHAAALVSCPSIWLCDSNADRNSPSLERLLLSASDAQVSSMLQQAPPPAAARSHSCR